LRPPESDAKFLNDFSRARAQGLMPLPLLFPDTQQSSSIRLPKRTGTIPAALNRARLPNRTILIIEI
jgi:hypothetical protein